MSTVIVRTRAYRADRWSNPGTYARLWIAVRLWSLGIPWYARDANLSHLLDATSPRPGTEYEGLSAETIARCCRKAVRRPLLMRDRQCLREGLLIYRFLTMAGFGPTLHFAVKPEADHTLPMTAHCWVKLGADNEFNPPESGMREVLVVSVRDGRHEFAKHPVDA